MYTLKKRLLAAVVFVAIFGTQQSAAFWPAYARYRWIPEIEQLSELVDKSFNSKNCLMRNKIVEDNGKKFLEVSVNNIASSTDDFKEMVKKDDGISIITNKGSLSITQSKNGIFVRAEVNDKELNYKQQQSSYSTLRNRIKFNELDKFEVTSDSSSKKAHIVIRLPLEDNQTSEPVTTEASKPLTKTYSFNTGSWESPAVDTQQK